MALACAALAADAQEFPGKKSDWHGYVRHEFQVDGRKCFVVVSKKGLGHHPHSLKDPAPIVEFILHHAAGKRPER